MASNLMLVIVLCFSRSVTSSFWSPLYESNMFNF